MKAINTNSRRFNELLTELGRRLVIKNKDKAKFNEIYQEYPINSDEYISALICKYNSDCFYSGIVYAIDWLISNKFANNLRIDVDENGNHYIKDFTEEWKEEID